MKTVLNSKNFDTLKQPLFLGKDLSLQRYDKFKYPIFFDLFKKQVEFTWFPHEISLLKDRSDYEKLPEKEKFVFDTNLRFQILGDSVLSRSIHTLGQYVSNPELEICMNFWASMECIHSYSYSYLLNNVYPAPSDFFDSIMDDKDIMKRLNLIKNNFDKILGKPEEDKDIKESILNAIIAVNCMEGLVFYVSFACSFWFGYKGIMVGNSDIIRMISRDENLHYSITQNILKIFKENELEGFKELIEQNKQKIYDIYNEAALNEQKWAEYLFSKGNLLGLNPETLGGYAKWLADNRLRSMGYDSIFNEKINPIKGWLDSYLDNSRVQTAPQEKENVSYKIAARNPEIKDEDFKDIIL